jgi:hypothetical protein
MSVLDVFVVGGVSLTVAYHAARVSGRTASTSSRTPSSSRLVPAVRTWTGATS